MWDLNTLTKTELTHPAPTNIVIYIQTGHSWWETCLSSSVLQSNPNNTTQYIHNTFPTPRLALFALKIMLFFFSKGATHWWTDTLITIMKDCLEKSTEALKWVWCAPANLCSISSHWCEHRRCFFLIKLVRIHLWFADVS